MSKKYVIFVVENEKIMAVSKEHIVSLKIAKLLKEKGFNEWCRQSYGMDVRYKGRSIDFDEECDLKDEGYGDDIEYIDGGMLYHNGWDNSEEKIYAAPTLYGAIKWLNTKGFHIYPSIEVDYDEDERGIKWYHTPAYYGEIIRIHDGKRMYDDGTLYATPELACEAAIVYCLEKYF